MLSKTQKDIQSWQTLTTINAKTQIQLPQNQKLPRWKLERDKNVRSVHTPALYRILADQN